jgi:hypothetical protein
VSPWNDEDVSGGLGVDVPKGRDVRVGVDHLSRDVPFGDPTEKA